MIQQHYILLQPRPKLASANEAGAEAESRDEAGSQNSHPRHLIPVELAKEFGRVALHGQRVEQPCSGEQRVVAGRQDASENDGIDDTARSLGPGHLEDNGEGRGACCLGVEVGVVVGDIEANEEDREDTERC